nr:unnamed protein product [Digitaria exilis]
MVRTKGQRSNPVVVGNSMSMAEAVASELLRRLERDEIPVEVAGAQLLKPPRRARLRWGCVANAWDSLPVGSRSSSFRDSSSGGGESSSSCLESSAAGDGACATSSDETSPAPARSTAAASGCTARALPRSSAARGLCFCCWWAAAVLHDGCWWCCCWRAAAAPGMGAGCWR